MSLFQHIKRSRLIQFIVSWPREIDCHRFELQNMRWLRSNRQVKICQTFCLGEITKSSRFRKPDILVRKGLNTRLWKTHQYVFFIASVLSHSSFAIKILESKFWLNRHTKDLSRFHGFSRFVFQLLALREIQVTQSSAAITHFFQFKKGLGLFAVLPFFKLNSRKKDDQQISPCH